MRTRSETINKDCLTETYDVGRTGYGKRTHIRDKESEASVEATRDYESATNTAAQGI